MALGFTFRASLFSTTGSASYAAAPTYTPAANSFILTIVVGSHASAPVDPDHATTPFSGHGLTWTKLNLVPNDLGGTHAMSIWGANAGSSPTSAACTAQWQTNRTGCAIIEYEITGADLSGGVLAAIKQLFTNTGTGTSGTVAMNASAQGGEADRCFAAFLHLANEGATPRTNWTEPAGSDGNFNNPATGLEAQYRADTYEQNASATWSGNVAWRGVAMEILAAGIRALGVGALALGGQLVGAAFQGPSAGALALSGTTMSVNVAGANTRTPPTGSLAFGGQAPTIVVQGGVSIPSGTLTLSGKAPTLGLTGGVTSVPVGPLTFAGQKPGVAFQGPSTGALILTGQTPTRTIGSGAGGGPQLAVPVGPLTLTGGFIDEVFSGPTEALLTLTGQTPTLFGPGIKPVPVGALTLTGRTLSLGTRVDLKVGTLTAAGVAPTPVISGGTDTGIGIPQAQAAFTGRTPTLAVQGNVTRSLGAGGLVFSGWRPEVGTGAVPPGELSLWIGGLNRTSQLKVNTLYFTDDLNARNTLSCELWEQTGSFHPQVGQEVILYATDGVTRLFAGTIEEPEEYSLLGVPGYGVRLSAVDYNQIADRHLAARAYDDTSFAAIVADLIATYLAADGVQVGAIDSGPTFPRKVFAYRPVSECLNELSEDTGYAWWIDATKTFYFRDREAITAPFSISLTNLSVRSISVKPSRNQYRNRQYIRAGRDLTDPLTESYAGDGERRTFTVGFPIGREPVVLLNGLAQTIGIRGVEDATAFDWYWNKDSTEVSQRSAGVPLTSSDTLEIIYQGLFPVLVQAQDDAKISERMSVEGGSGLYEAIEDLADIDSADLALGTAVAKLQRHGFIRTTITFETDRDGLATSQLIHITLPPHNVDADYLIQAVSAHDVNGKFLRYLVTAIDGEAVGGWIAFYQQLMARRRESIDRENESLLALRSFTDVVLATDSLTTDIPVTKETRIGLAQIGRSEIGVL